VGNGVVAIYTNDTQALTVNASQQLQLNQYGAGTLTTDASGNVIASSDMRLKNKVADFSRGLDDLLGITPIAYKWKSSTGFDTENTYYGFSAQNVKINIPEAVGEDPRGYLTLSDRPLLAASINAIKELDLKIEDIQNDLQLTTDNPQLNLFERVARWFEDKVLSVVGLKAEKVETDELCIDGLCIGREELEEILQSRQGPNVLDPVSDPAPADPEPASKDPEAGDGTPTTKSADQLPDDKLIDKSTNQPASQPNPDETPKPDPIQPSVSAEKPADPNLDKSTEDSNIEPAETTTNSQ
jgi:hypothetical protein